MIQIIANYLIPNFIHIVQLQLYPNSPGVKKSRTTQINPCILVH